ncbi:MAG: FRG domain-containing protein [Methanobrevibacter sp.]|uniref:FRG domain-containing protein n=1 Tax=Methanobrevibacter sp. TaxID=66852 RepID=UPI002E79FE7E|nr:FRG domain-containing protein [Methanobrevibacter sp.]MEE0935877.1 FRG domain-containing protein [Methanobrevibacter sp.]
MCNGVKKITIKSYDELVNIVRGKDKIFTDDLREDFVFRGISNIEYDLIPSALRKNELNELNINEFIESDCEFKVSIDKTEAINNGLDYDEDCLTYDGEVIVLFDKYGNLISDKNNNFKAPEYKIQKEREYYVLLKFLSYADKCGLKVNAEEILRFLIHNKLNEPFENFLDQTEVIEVMSLAQHYGLPTRALDWSYDYRVALYFTVKDVLNSNNNSDGVLWALNHKLIEVPEYNNLQYNLRIHRPEYNTNPNLNAQKGLFTFLERYVGDYDKPLDEIISSELNQKPENKGVSISKDVKVTVVPSDISKDDVVFYKFIIPNEIKPEILKELYLEGYSEEYLFPGYEGVSKSILNRVKLNEILKNHDGYIKKSILLSGDWNLNEIINKNQLYVFVNFDFKEEIDKIFIYHDNKIVGYFRGNEIIKNSLNVLWEQFGKHSGLSEDKFNECFKGNNEAFAIRINDLNMFKYPIKLCGFEFVYDFCFVEDIDDLKFLSNFN